MIPPEETGIANPASGIIFSIAGAAPILIAFLGLGSPKEGDEFIIKQIIQHARGWER